jgi:hypothetical protein
VCANNSQILLLLLLLLLLFAKAEVNVQIDDLTEEIAGIEGEHKEQVKELEVLYLILYERTIC